MLSFERRLLREPLFFSVMSNRFPLPIQTGGLVRTLNQSDSLAGLSQRCDSLSACVCVCVCVCECTFE